tara:strand:+ start:516 stop:734 length:219 start_codon:yes stop_codon:yes gene_type:complete
MELMNWFTKPLDRFLIWLGSSVFDSTIFGIKLGYIVAYVGMIYLMFNLTDLVYEKGFDEGVKSTTIGVNENG